MRARTAAATTRGASAFAEASQLASSENPTQAAIGRTLLRDGALAALQARSGAEVKHAIFPRVQSLFAPTRNTQQAGSMRVRTQIREGNLTARLRSRIESVAVCGAAGETLELKCSQ